MYKDELEELRHLTHRHELSPEISMRLIKLSEDIMKTMSLPLQMKSEVLYLVATTISKESANLLEQEGLI